KHGLIITKKCLNQNINGFALYLNQNLIRKSCVFLQILVLKRPRQGFAKSLALKAEPESRSYAPRPPPAGHRHERPMRWAGFPKRSNPAAAPRFPSRESAPHPTRTNRSAVFAYRKPARKSLARFYAPASPFPTTDAKARRSAPPRS